MIDATELLARLLLGITDDGLEELTYRLVKPDHPTAKWLRAPYDYGLDVHVPPREGERAIGWQAKNYKDRLYWDRCADSVGRAMGKWNPRCITFVFPRRLTTSEYDDWAAFREEQLRLHETLEELVLLDDLATRVAERTDLVEWLAGDAFGGYVKPLLDRMDQSGVNPLASAEDRALKALAGAAASAATDPSYDYRETTQPARKGPAGKRFRLVPDAEQQLPLLKLTVSDGRYEAEIAALPRPEAGVRQPQVWFADTETGRQTLEDARVELAHGRPVQLAGDDVGVLLDTVPDKFKDEVGPDKVLRGGTVGIELSEPVELTVTLTQPDASQHTRQFTLRRVPPRPGYDTAFAGALEGAVAYFDLQRVGPEFAQGSFGFESHPAGVPAAELLRGFDFAEKLATAQRVHLDAPGLLPVGGLDDSENEPYVANGADLEPLRISRAIAEVVAEIDARAGGHIAIPSRITSDDLRQLEILRILLHDGELRRPIEGVEEIIMPPGSPSNLGDYDDQLSVALPLTLFGQRIGLRVTQSVQGAVARTIRVVAGAIPVVQVAPQDGVRAEVILVLTASA